MWLAIKANVMSPRAAIKVCRRESMVWSAADYISVSSPSEGGWSKNKWGVRSGAVRSREEASWRTASTLSHGDGEEG